MLSVCAGFSLATDNANAQAYDNPLSGLYAQAGIGYSERASEDYVHFQLGIDKGSSSGWYISYKGGDDNSSLLTNPKSVGKISIKSLDTELKNETVERSEDNIIQGLALVDDDSIILNGIEGESYAITLGFISGFPAGDNGSFFYGIGLGTGNIKITAKTIVDETPTRLSLNEDYLAGELFFGLEHKFTDNLSLVGRVFAFYQSDWSVSGQLKSKTEKELVTLENDSNWSLGADLGIKFTF